MATIPDWLVIGSGITGACLAYELARQGLRVVLLEKDSRLINATYYSYGGIAYWSATTDFTRDLFQEGIALHRNLSTELDATTEFREINLLLTIPKEISPESIVGNLQQCWIPPKILSPQEAIEIEPLLNADAISGVFLLPHGHINPYKTNVAYQQAFLRLGGEIIYDTAVKVLSNEVHSDSEVYRADKIAICAGGLTRQLLQTTGVTIPIYFTHAQLIKTPPVNIQLSNLVMPAQLSRLALESMAKQNDYLWNEAHQEILPPVLEAGAIQFLDGSLCMGQISQFLGDPDAKLDLEECEAQIRRGIGCVLPSLAGVEGTIHSCLVAFSADSYPLVGEVESVKGVYVFSGFTSPLIFVPPMARRFAKSAHKLESENIIQPLCQ